MDEMEDWDDIVLTDDDSSLQKPANRIVGICADKYIATADNKWDDDFAFDKSEGSGDFFGGSVPLSPQVPHADEKKGDSTTGDVTDLEDWEDWDAELGIDTEPSNTQTLPSMNVSTVSVAETGVIPPKHRFVQEKADVVIIKYPKLPLLYTLKEKEGHRLFFSEEDFCTWISNLMRNPLLCARSVTTFGKQKSIFHQQKIDYEPLSTKWITTHVTYCQDMVRLEETEVLWEMLVQLFAELQPNQFAALPFERIKSVDMFLFYMVQSACKIWNSSIDGSFIQDIIEAAKSLRPVHADQFDLFQAECYAHHSEESAFMNKAPLDMFVDLYCRQREQDSETALQLRVQILIDVHLYTSCYSPLTSAKLDIDPDSRQDEVSDLIRERGRQAEDLLLSEMRISTLTDIYRKIPEGFLKAKAAFVLAMADECDLKDHQGAERKYFEALYLLHTFDSGVPEVFPIVSELGTNVLQSFASKLEFQSKYQYAIQVYHACGQVFQLRGCTKDYLTLLRKMAASSKEFDDYNRALSYYKELLQQYIQDKKINEIVFVSEILSKIYADVGRFDIAEEYLLGAYSKLPKRQRVTTNQSTFQLLFSLAKLYLNGFFYERGILLLEHLSESPHPRGKQASIISTLAQGYIMKRNFRACQLLLQSGASNDMKRRHTRTKSMGRPVHTSLGSGSLSKKLSFHEIAARNYLLSHKYIDAVSSIDMAINSAQRSNFNALGNHFYLRGKIFQAVCCREEEIQYPITLVKEKEGKQKAKTYESEGDVLQECIACYRKAYKYFCAIGDDIRETKTLIRIAETYLDCLFVPVLLQHQSMANVCSFPYFEASDILYKPGVDHTPLRNGDKFEISLGMIEAAASLGLDNATEFCIPLLCLQSYMNMAELKLLQGDLESAQAFWDECAYSLFHGFVLPFIGKYAKPGLLSRIHRVLKRVIRVMFCFSQEIINKNLILLDANNLLELTIEQSLQSTVPPINDAGPNSLLKLVTIHNERIMRRPLVDISKSKKERERATNLKKAQAKRQLTSSRLSTTVRNFFGDKEEIDWATVSPPAETDNDPALLAYGALHCVKSLLGRYSSRKQALEKVAIFERNQKQVRMMLKCGKRARDLAFLFSPIICNEEENKNLQGSSSQLMDSSSVRGLSVSYKDLEDKCPAVSRVLYVLYNSGCLMTYSPSVPRSVKVQRIIRPDDKTTEQTCEKTLPEPHRKSTEERNKYIIKVTAMTNDSEFGIFEVKHSVTLKEFLLFVCDISQWCPNATVDVERNRKPTSRSTFRMPRSTKALKIPIKPLESTRCFGDEISSLVSLLNISPPSSPSVERNEESSKLSGGRSKSALCVSDTMPLPELSFALRTEKGVDIHLIPLVGSMNNRIYTLFPDPSRQENLYLYASSFYPSVTEMDLHSQLTIGQTLSLTPSMISLLHRIVNGKLDKTFDETSHKRVLTDMTHRFYDWAKEIIPPCPDAHLHRTAMGIANRTVEDCFEASEVSSFPLMLVCPPSVQIFPWELVFSDVTIRNLSLCNVLHREKFKRTILEPNGDLLPTFYSFCYASNVQAQEEDRRKHCVENALTRLSLSSTMGAPKYLIPTVLPFQSQFRKKRSIRNFISEETLGNNAASVIDYFENQSESLFNVFILSYENLVELNQVSSYLMSCACNCTMLFVPRSHMKTVIQRILKATPTASKKDSSSRYQFLVSQIEQLQREYQIPIVIYNSP